MGGLCDLGEGLCDLGGLCVLGGTLSPEVGGLCALGTASLRFILHGDPSMDADSQMEA